MLWVESDAGNPYSMLTHDVGPGNKQGLSVQAVLPAFMYGQ